MLFELHESFLGSVLTSDSTVVDRMNTSRKNFSQKFLPGYLSENTRNHPSKDYQ